MQEDEDHDALAGEYVLGTLSAEEREHAEGLLSFDPAFEAAVRHWERRLGELNVMVEAVEPPAEVWEKIKARVTAEEAGSGIEFPDQHESLPEAANLAIDFPPGDYDAEGALPPPIPGSVAVPPLPAPPPPVSPPSLSVTPPTAPSKPPEAPALLPASPAPPEPAKIQRSADVIYLARRVKRWRRMTYTVGAIAALLAIYIALWQVAPELIPAQLRQAGGMIARLDGGSRTQQNRLVAVLQQGPTAPAFLLTLDTQQRTLIVRRISAKPEAGKSYELWLIAGRGGPPRSLGVVSNDEFTQRAISANFDADTLRGATYAVSLEPAGGSTSGAPTGPVLFTGKAVESVPVPQPKT